MEFFTDSPQGGDWRSGIAPLRANRVWTFALYGLFLGWERLHFVCPHESVLTKEDSHRGNLSNEFQKVCYAYSS
jgi:hypothetical protein